jgi:hypothetical protein
MRRPLESFSIDFDIATDVIDRLRWALNASTLVLTRRPIVILLDPWVGANRSGGAARSPSTP